MLNHINIVYFYTTLLVISKSVNGFNNERKFKYYTFKNLPVCALRRLFYVTLYQISNNNAVYIFFYITILLIDRRLIIFTVLDFAVHQL